jgi:protein-tyrosine phosphatase
MGRTDIHSHLLPNIDDGARSLEIALDLYRMAVADGTTHLVATPHCNYEYAFDPARNAQALAAMREQIPELSITLGCELHLSDANVAAAIADPSHFTCGESNYLLVEFDDFVLADQVAVPINRLHRAGFRTIVAHPERNLMFLREIQHVERFRDLGCRMQITADSLSGNWGRPAKMFAEKMLKNGLVDVIASDAHSQHRRPPHLAQAEKMAASIVGAQKARMLVEDNPAAIVANQPLS